MKPLNQFFPHDKAIKFIEKYESGKITENQEVVIKNGVVRKKGSLGIKSFSRWKVKTHEALKNFLDRSDRSVANYDDVNAPIKARQIYELLSSHDIYKSAQSEDESNADSLLGSSTDTEDSVESSLMLADVFDLSGLESDGTLSLSGDSEGSLSLSRESEGSLSRSGESEGSILFAGRSFYEVDGIPFDGTPFLKQSEDDPGLYSRCFLETEVLYPEEFLKLAHSGEFSPNVHYMVRGSLKFKGNDKIRFPEHVTIYGDLQFIECKNPIVLPSTLKVKEQFIAWNCQKLTALPDNMTVGGHVKLCYCNGLKTLGKGLKIIGNPEEASSGGLIIQRCRKLKTIGDKVKIHGIIKVIGLDGLETLSITNESGSKSNGIFLKNCSKLRSLSGNRVLTGNVDVVDCKSFETLDLKKIAGNLILSNCPKITNINKVKTVGGNVELTKCNGLTTLPDDLKVSRSLKVDNCSKFIELPKKNGVGRDIIIENCPKFIRLPHNFKTGSSLTIRRSGLKETPQELTIKGTLTIEECHKLKQIVEYRGNVYSDEQDIWYKIGKVILINNKKLDLSHLQNFGDKLAIFGNISLDNYESYPENTFTIEGSSRYERKKYNDSGGVVWQRITKYGYLQ